MAKSVASSTEMNFPLSFVCGISENTSETIQSLFEMLQKLPAMDKYGPMSGSCSDQTYQMEDFLEKNFGFRNVHGEYIVQGVRKFKLDKPPSTLPSSTVIKFPTEISESFQMTILEINEWQKSYAVYTDRNIPDMTPDFLCRALQGGSQDGEEAFRMKFVIRISTCPILMEFDGKVIERQLDEKWPNRIKLVSVSGIDFAGRKHDVDDIRNYISNWRDIFAYNKETDLPIPYNGRDFVCNSHSTAANLDEEKIRNDLYRMAYLRMYTCDNENVQVVVETGIGLGVFSGSYIGIDGKIREWSACALKSVLEEHGSSFKNIQAVVLALPIFNSRRDPYYSFVEEFEKSYQGSIPVLIVDQDMHRLTVAIARRGFVVSELNPADSHGVFGEYWQNMGPAVEEKLALTTVGLLVQHHLINEEVLNPKNYHFI